VGSASATGSVGARTTWAGSQDGDMGTDKMSESQDMEMDTSSVGGMSEDQGSLVAFGEGARTPARQSVIGSPTSAAVGKASATPTGRDPKMIDGMTYDPDVVDTTAVSGPGAMGAGRRPFGAGAEQAERIVREHMDTTSNDRMRDGPSGKQGGPLGQFGWEK
jgi:hypothetical protein